MNNISPPQVLSNLFISSLAGIISLGYVGYLNRAISLVPIKDLMLTASTPLFAAKTIHQLVDSLLPQEKEISAKRRQFKLYTIDFLTWVGMTAMVGTAVSLSVSNAYFISSGALVAFLVLNTTYRLFTAPATNEPHNDKPVSNEKPEPIFADKVTTSFIFENPDLLLEIFKKLITDDSFEEKRSRLRTIALLSKRINNAQEKAKAWIFKEHFEIPLLDYFDTYKKILALASKHNFLKVNLMRSKINRNDLKKLHKCLPHITHLNLKANFIFGGCVKIISNFDKLKHLNISGNVKITDSDITKIVQGLPLLEELNINGCTGLRDVGIQWIANLSHLTRLSMKGSKITNQTLELIIFKLPNLTHLNIKLCRDVSNQGVMALAKLQKLSSLNLSGCMLDESVLKNLSILTQLKEFNIKNIQLSNTGALELAKMIQLTSLNVSFCDVTDEKMKILADHLINLRILKMGGCLELTDLGITHLTRWIHLIELDLSNCSNQYLESNFTPEAFQSLAVNLNHLKKINVNSCKINDSHLLEIAKMVNLTHLYFSSSPKVTDVGLEAIAKSLSHLKSLLMDSCHSITDQGISDNAPFLKNLTELSIKGISLKEKSLREISTSMKKLKRLDMDGSIEGEGLSLLSHLKELQILSLERCNLTDQDLEVLSKNLSKLKYLNIGHNNKITTNGLQFIAAHLSKLWFLSLHKSKQITSESIIPIVHNLKRLMFIDGPYTPHTLELLKECNKRKVSYEVYL